MGKGADGGGTRRAHRHTGSMAAAAAGATALATAAAVAHWQRRRRERAITPEDSLAGPPPRIAPAPAPTTTSAVAPPATPGALDLAPIPVDDGPEPARSPEPPASPLAVAAPTRVGTPGPAPSPEPAPSLGSAPSREPLRAAPDSPPVLASPARRRPPRGAAVVIGLVLVLVLGIGALAVAGGGPDDAEAADPRPTAETGRPARSTTTTTAPVTAVDAFARASLRLTEAGSFTYTGTADATDVSVARPMLWLAVATTVEGAVVTPTGRLREVSVAADGSATETVAAASEVWGRRASSVAALADVPLEAVPGLSGSAPAGRGAALLPSWLSAAVAPSDAGPDEQGRRRFQATIPAAAIGVVERDTEPVDALVTLTLDDDGDPARVEIVSSPDGPPFRLVFEIGGLGDPIVIETPADAAAPIG